MLKNKKVLIGGAIFLAVAFWFYVKPNYLDKKPVAVFTEAEIAAAPRPSIHIAERVFNLKAPPSAPNYVKVAVALEFADPEHKYLKLKGHAIVVANEHFTEELEPDMPKILDILTSLIGGRTVEEVASTEGREKLKDDLVVALNKEFKHEKVENVYFATFITQ
ncbi:MAG: flagellar basal body-associated protein FliL [Dehalococcoidia bacterium]